MARTTKEQPAAEVDAEVDLDDDGGPDDAHGAPEAELADIEDGLGDDDDDAGDSGDPPIEEAEALDKLEAEELQMLTEDEAAEVIAVDEQEELRRLRREQMAMDTDAAGVGADEFVCQSCFLVKRTSQLADTRNKICRDCAA